MACRGVRGATTVTSDTRDEILAATRELLEEIVAANRIAVSDIASVILSATPDLRAAYPAEAARQLGWTDTALLCVQEMSVPSSLARCIRVLLHWNTEKPARQLIHVYLNDAAALRPDWTVRQHGSTTEEGSTA